GHVFVDDGTGADDCAVTNQSHAWQDGRIVPDPDVVADGKGVPGGGILVNQLLIRVVEQRVGGFRIHRVVMRNHARRPRYRTVAADLGPAVGVEGDNPTAMRVHANFHAMVCRKDSPQGYGEHAATL